MSLIHAERNRLEAVMREEVSGQRRILALLREQESAVIARGPERLVEITTSLEEELSSAASRRLRREPIVRALAKLFGVAVSALTLGSLCQRLGADAAKLQSLREELRDVTARVVRQNRRVAALVGLHRRVNQEVLELVLADEDSNPLRQTGALVDAEV